MKLSTRNRWKVTPKSGSALFCFYLMNTSNILTVEKGIQSDRFVAKMER